MLITPEGIEATSLRCAVEAAAEVFGRSVVVQARAKASVVDARRVAVLVAEAARACGVPFVVNGDVGLARELAADGVHAPSGMPAGGLRAALGGLWLSRAAHAEADVRAAAAHTLDALLVSPSYPGPGGSVLAEPSVTTPSYFHVSVACPADRTCTGTFMFMNKSADDSGYATVRFQPVWAPAREAMPARLPAAPAKSKEPKDAG